MEDIDQALSDDMAASALQRSASSAVQRTPPCVVCGQAIVQQYNRFKCTEAGGEKLTKLGCILEDVTDKANIHLKISMHTVSHMCWRCREFLLRVDKTYQNFLSMQKKLQDLLKPRLTTGDFAKTSICSKSPDREQQHLKITEYEMSKRTLTPVRDNELKSKKPMRLLLPNQRRDHCPHHRPGPGCRQQQNAPRSELGLMKMKMKVHQPLELILIVNQMYVSHQQVHAQLPCHSIKKR